MNKLANDLHVPQGDLPWKVIEEGSYVKLLRTCSVTGAWVVMFRNDPGTSVTPHKHLGPAEYYVLRGKIEIRGGVENGGITANAGDYGGWGQFEPPFVTGSSIEALGEVPLEQRNRF